MRYSGKWQQEWNGAPMHEFITSARSKGAIYTYSHILLGREHTSSPWPSLIKNHEKLSQGWKIGNTAIIDPEIIRYKANRFEIQIQGRGRMEINIGARESFS